MEILSALQSVAAAPDAVSTGEDGWSGSAGERRKGMQG